MEETGNGSKLTGIRQIVRLKEILQKWQNVALGQEKGGGGGGSCSNHQSEIDGDGGESPPHGGISPAISRRLANGGVYCDSDEESCQSPGPPPDVPKGYLAVYVGPELRRFIIPTSYLSHSLFKLLLEKAEEEFGFDHCGALTLPCEIETFKFLLKCMENHQKDHHPDDSWRFPSH